MQKLEGQMKNKEEDEIMNQRIDNINLSYTPPFKSKLVCVNCHAEIRFWEDMYICPDCKTMVCQYCGDWCC